MNVRSSDKQQRILDATMALVAENGLHATPMSQISKRSQVSAGAIYHYFPSKESIINQLYLSLKQDILAALFRGYDIQAPYQGRFLGLWHNALDHFIAHPMQLSVIEQCAHSTLITPEVKAETNRYLAPLIGFLTEGVESGQLKPMEISLLMALIESSINAVAKLKLSGALDITDQQRHMAAQVCWEGVKSS